MKRRVLSILILGANLLNVAAQNMTSSPVSMFGLGELSTGEGGIYSGLGGVGIALRGENVINSANPASLTGLLPQYFFFDLGVSGSYLKYSQSGASNHSLNGNLNNLGAGFRICLVINSERYIIMVIHGMFTISENDSLNCVIKIIVGEKQL